MPATDASATAPAARRAGVPQGLVLIFISALPTMAIVSLVPNLPQLFAQFRDVPRSEFFVPMIITLPSLCIAIFSPIAGTIADFWGRRRLLLVATALYTVVGVLPALLDDLFAILATRFAIGIAEAAILTSQNALMGDYFAGQERQKWLGRLSVIGPFVASSLVLAGGFLGSISWRAPFLLYLLGIPMLLWAAYAVYEPHRETIPPEAAGPVQGRFPWNAVLLVVPVTVGAAVLYFIQAIQLGRMFGDHGVASPAQIGVMVTIASAGVVVGGWLFARLPNLPVMHRFAIVFLALAVGYAGIGLAPGAYAALPFAFIAQIGNGLTIPTLIGWALGKFDFEHRGRGMGIWGSSFFVGTFLSPPIVTLVGTATGSFLATVAAFGFACFVLAAVVWIAGRRALRANSAAAPTAS